MIPESAYRNHFQRANAEQETRATFELVATTHGFRIYRKANTYRVYGIVDTVTVQQYAAFYEDDVDRKRWDKNTIECKTLAHDADANETTYYSVLAYPFPFSNRDYVYVRGKQSFVDGAAIVYVAQSCTHETAPERRRYVRVRDYRCGVVLTPTKDGHCALYTEFEEDPRLSYVPDWLRTWIFEKAVPSFVASLKTNATEHALKVYKE